MRPSCRDRQDGERCLPWVRPVSFPSGRRSRTARETVCAVCRRSLDLFPYVDFDKVGREDRCRLSRVSARDQNRDSDAVRYCCEKLLRRPERRKLLIVVTDGAPLAIDYGGPAAEEELRTTAGLYRKRGIRIFAFSIGDRHVSETVSSIYGKDWTADCSDPSTLAPRLAGLFRRLLSDA